MRTLVTGATGFLGSWVTRALCEAGHQPRVLVRDATRLAPLNDLALEVARGDILDPTSLEVAVRDVATSTRMVNDYLEGRTRFYLPGGLSFADARDVAAAYVSALERGRSGHSDVLAGVNRSYRELLEQLCRLTGLPPALPCPWFMAEMSAWWSDVASLYVEHPFEELNPSVIQYGRYFNFCDRSKAGRELGYRSRPFELTLRDTIHDLWARWTRRAVGAPRAEPAWSGRRPSAWPQSLAMTQRTKSSMKRRSRESGKPPKQRSNSWRAAPARACATCRA